MTERICIYEVTGSNDYQWLAYAPDEDLSFAEDWFRGRPIGPAWRPQAVFFGDTPVHRHPRADLNSLGAGIPVFSRRAVEQLRDLLEPNGEILPLAYARDFSRRRGNGWFRTRPLVPEEPLFAFNVTRVVDALDAEHSDIVQFGDRRVMVIRRPAFRAERLAGLVLFKVPEWPVATYLTEEFMRRAGEAGLTGLSFAELRWRWDAGLGPDGHP